MWRSWSGLQQRNGRDTFKHPTFPLHVHHVQEVPPDWLDGLQTQTVNVGGRIISTQGCQVNKGDGLQQPSSLQDRRGTDGGQLSLRLLL